jgi:hypothetical protein
VRDIVLAAREKIVDAEDVVAGRDQPVAEMRTEKSRTATDQNLLALEFIHGEVSPSIVLCARPSGRAC